MCSVLFLGCRLLSIQGGIQRVPVISCRASVMINSLHSQTSAGLNLAADRLRPQYSPLHFIGRMGLFLETQQSHLSHTRCVL